MSLVTFFKLTLSRMAVWPTRRTRFGASLKALYPSTAHLCLPLPTRAGACDGLGAGDLRASVVWGLAECRPPSCGPLLGVARVAATRLGAFRSIHRFQSLSFQLLIKSYWGGAVTAIGGALVTGAWVRITRAKRWRYAWLFGIGAVIVVPAAAV